LIPLMAVHILFYFSADWRPRAQAGVQTHYLRLVYVPLDDREPRSIHWAGCSFILVLVWLALGCTTHVRNLLGLHRPQCGGSRYLAT
jgi:hypothetical protein